MNPVQELAADIYLSLVADLDDNIPPSEMQKQAQMALQKSYNLANAFFVHGETFKYTAKAAQTTVTGPIVPPEPEEEEPVQVITDAPAPKPAAGTVRKRAIGRQP